VLELTVLLAVEVVILIEIIVVVDVDVAVVPIAIAPVAASPSPQRESRGAPCQPHPGVVPWIGIRVIGISRGRSSVDDLWVVGRDVNYVGLSWLNYDYLLAAFDCFGLHCLLGGSF
jgi:hypothetical protein